ncbi:MAG TPA: DUF2934 domain-containing protein [Dissulfurispiraceae bacterium]|nr:DUF2934 domain-containing protein [Dissulfurispiraceae bacterium]
MNLYDEIAKEAYYLFEKSGRRPGCEHENWIEAERIVMARHAGREAAERGKAVAEKEAPKKTAPKKSEPKKTETKTTKPKTATRQKKT